MDSQKVPEPLQMASVVEKAVPDLSGHTAHASASAEQLAFRNDLTEQLMAMSRFLLINDTTDPIGQSATAVLGALDRGEQPLMEDMIAAHQELKILVAPATPGALVAKSGRLHGRKIGRFLGPNTVVRNLALANMFFMVSFLGISLSPQINEAMLELSIYQQSGLPLLLKFGFLISASGLGASFGALFDVWDEIKSNRFDPSAESVHWMKIGLGIVAGIALTEIFQASASTPDGGSTSTALIALVGGFSAGLLHVALSRTVNAVKSIFAPSDKP